MTTRLYKRANTVYGRRKIKTLNTLNLSSELEEINELHGKLAKGPLSLTEASNQLGYHPKAALKFFRLLASLNVITMNDNLIQATSLTESLESIKSEHFYGSYAAFEFLEKSLKENRPCWEDAFGKPFYDHLNDQPEKPKEFERYCTLTAKSWFSCIQQYFPFEKFEKIVDVGGGEGWLLTTNKKWRSLFKRVGFSEADTEVNIIDNDYLNVPIGAFTLG